MGLLTALFAAELHWVCHSSERNRGGPVMWLANTLESGH